tara:strand:- start:76 stop:363 length:288 start_codon:yes stop_codon:yes gene_type:complete
MQNAVDFCFKIYYNKQRSGKMKLNFLLPRKEAEEVCDASYAKRRKHSWLLGGQIRKSVGGSVGVEFFCKKCERRYWHFFTPEEYGTYKNILGEVA